MKDGKPVGFHSREIGKIFYGYTGGAYADYLADLKSLGILDFPRHYKKATPNRRGECRKYWVTDLGCQLLHSGDMEYLKKLKSEPKLKHANKKSILNRKVMTKTYDDPVLNYIHEGLKNISFDADKAEKMISQSCWSVAQKRSVSSGLRRFAEKDFSELEYKDGRVYHELVTLKSEARQLLDYNGGSYKAVLDIRCCHPNFFSYFIITHPNTIHYVTQNQTKSGTLEQEHLKWIALFSNPAIDPKETIRKECRFKDVDHAKRAMNESLNGSGRYKKTYLKWLQREFPMLYMMWQQTHVKHTGKNITEKFEHPLIQDKELCSLAESLGVKIMSEHDGVGVFAADDDTGLENKLPTLAAQIEASSIRLFGVPVVVKVKPVFNLLDGDLRADMEHKRGQYKKDLNQLQPNVDRLRRKYFSPNSEGTKTWQEHEAAKAKVVDLNLRYNDVLAYWKQREEENAAQEAAREKLFRFDENNCWQ